MTSSGESRVLDLAELYDLDVGDFTDDLAFYEALAEQSGGAVLELGVGTGRVALQLARAGHEVWGVDHDEAMLDRARCKAGDMPGLHLVLADVRGVKLDRQFGLIYAGYGAFHHLITPEDQLACLRTVEEHLLDGGAFVFDLRAIFATDWDPGESVPLLHDWTRAAATGEVVTKFRSVRVDQADQVQHETYYYDVVEPDGTLRRATTSVVLRFSTRYEIDMLVREAGLMVERVYADYDLSPYGDSSDLMITVARKQARS